jgi:glyoxylase-like metal-dependent hydrolase (beta-lactamase superfamily II)
MVANLRKHITIYKFALLIEINMKLYTIETEYFKLDGGAMFGVVPKVLWNKLNPSDENNLCSWAMRCLLIEDGNRLILIDNGIGDKQSAKFFGYYYLHGEHTLEKSLASHGFRPEDITDNIVTHLHFDHCGGGIKWNKDHTGYEPTFPNATYYVGEDQWNLALHPNAREKASFLRENILPMQETGHLKLVKEEGELLPGISVKMVNGHTECMMIPRIAYNGKVIYYMADLLPSHYHIPTAWIMAYDTQPLISMQEKVSFLDKALSEDSILFLEHDPHTECCTIERTDSGAKLKETMKLSQAV